MINASRAPIEPADAGAIATFRATGLADTN
jgi:hypothetical protein